MPKMSKMKISKMRHYWYKFWAYFWYPKIWIRSIFLANYLTKYLAGYDSILDIGGGQGILSVVLAKKLKIKVVNTDIVDYSTKGVPFVLCQENKLPFADKEFSASLLIDVLHHSRDPENLLKETIRVTKKRVLVIENYHYSAKVVLAKYFHWLFDAVQTVIFGIPLPRIASLKKWRAFFKKLSLRIETEENLKGKIPLINQYLFVLCCPKKILLNDN